MARSTKTSKKLPAKLGSAAWLAPLPEPHERPVPHFDGGFERYTTQRLFVRRTPDTGQGSTAVFVHGLGGQSRNWTDLMYTLSPMMRGIAPDLPGFGKSPRSRDGKYSLDRHAEAVIDVIEANATEPVFLFGNSMGGAIATRIAAERPDLVRALTLSAPAFPSHRLRPGAVPLVLLANPVFRKIYFQLPFNNNARLAVERGWRLVYADTSRVHPERHKAAIEDAAERMQLDHRFDALIGSVRGLGRAMLLDGDRALWASAAKVQAPTLVVLGTEDQLVDVRVATKLSRTLPSNRTVVLADCGHVPQMEAPKRVANEALDWWMESGVTPAITGPKPANLSS